MSAASEHIPISASESGAERALDMPEPAPNPQLLAALGRLVRGLSALFWGLPIALVVCVQTAKGDWLRPFGVVPALAATALLLYGLNLLGHFQRQERVWRSALDRARIFALLNVGLSPFLYWWNRMPSNEFFNRVVEVMAVCGLVFLFTLNPVLWRLSAMLPDEALRLETRLFTAINRGLLVVTAAVLLGYLVLNRPQSVPDKLVGLLFLLDRAGLWIGLFVVLLPVAMTMALIWKIKEVILASVFGPEE
jgi:hypothetical protein